MEVNTVTTRMRCIYLISTLCVSDDRLSCLEVFDHLRGWSMMRCRPVELRCNHPTKTDAARALASAAIVPLARGNFYFVDSVIVRLSRLGCCTAVAGIDS